MAVRFRRLDVHLPADLESRVADSDATLDPCTDASSQRPREDEVLALDPSTPVDRALSTVPGVGPTTYTQLEDAGLTTAGDLWDAGVDGLRDVYGIGAALSERIIGSLAESRDDDSTGCCPE
jgi:hypothetical protein